MTILKRMKLLTACVFLLVGTTAKADINVTSYIASSGLTALFIEGEIAFGDEKKFLQKAMQVEGGVIFLNSPGGNVISAMEIGKIIRLKNFKTAVLPNNLCVSACALAWLAGTERYLDQSSALGFHASYIKQDGRLLETGVGNALVGRYLTQLNLSENAIIFVTSAPPEGMNWLLPSNSERVGIPVKFIDSVVGRDATELAKNAPKPEPYDAIAAVSKFYGFLSRADGEGAAALVIPEKRGKGPFNEVSITQFFGSMKEPLRILKIQRETENKVLVTYRYTRGDNDRCEATAQVFTTYAFGKTLIERISARC